MFAFSLKIIGFLLLSNLVITNTWASYVNAAIKDAVVDDASACYYNPAALSLRKTPELMLAFMGVTNVLSYSGDARKPSTGFNETGLARSNQFYPLPSLYFALPLSPSITVGIGSLYSFYGKLVFNNDSLLRYNIISASLETPDIVPSIALKLSDAWSIGAGLDIQYTRFNYQFLFESNEQSFNKATGWDTTWHAGLLFTPFKKTTLGFTYYAGTTLNLRGNSVAANTTEASNQFQFNLPTPNRAVFSINQQLSSGWGAIGTISYSQWSVLNTLKLTNVATPIGPVDASYPFMFRNTSRFTLEPYYAITDKVGISWLIGYEQEPGNPNTQIVEGNDIIAGIELSYQMTPAITIQAGYGYEYFLKQKVHISGIDNIGRNNFTGNTTGYEQGIVLQLIWDFQ